MHVSAMGSRPALWAGWALVTALGGIGALSLALLLGLVAPSQPGIYMVQGEGFVGLAALFGVWTFAGLLTGLGQCMILKRYLRGFSCRSWVLATVGGYFLAVIVWLSALLLWLLALMLIGVVFWFVQGNQPLQQSPNLLTLLAGIGLNFVGVVVAWAAIGIAQWTVLSKYAPQANRWIIANAAAAALVQSAVFITMLILARGTPLADSLQLDIVTANWTATFFLSGIITGRFLVQLLDHSSLAHGIAT